MNSLNLITLVYVQGMKRILLLAKGLHFDTPSLPLAPFIGNKLIKIEITLERAFPTGLSHAHKYWKMISNICTT